VVVRKTVPAVPAAKWILVFGGDHELAPLTPADTTIVMVGHAIGFANALRSHDTVTHINNVIGPGMSPSTPACRRASRW
jgi:hypothetical protein